MLKTCFRCDWEGETKGSGCPTCGTQPLYVVGVSPRPVEVAPVATPPVERGGEAPTAPSPPETTTPPPPPVGGGGTEPNRRPSRSTIAYVLAALALIVLVGALLNRRGEPSPGSTAATSDAPSSIVAPSSGRSAVPKATTAIRRDGEVLTTRGPELVAVDPDTGVTRSLLDLGVTNDLRPTAVGGEVLHGRITYAAWSPDGRWLVFEGPGRAWWVMNSDMGIRKVANAHDGEAVWSPTRPELAMILGSHLTIVEAPTSRMTDLGKVVGDVTSTPVWSPDGRRLIYGARGGTLRSVDVRSGEASVLVRLPGKNLDSMDQIEWSPDGAHIAIMNDLQPGGGRLYVVNADGSGVRVLRDNYEPGGLAWSPDGRSIAYAGSHDGAARLWVVPRIGGRSLTVAAGHSIEGPVWSPDGRRIGFTGSSGWFAVEADGAHQPVAIDRRTYLSWGGGSFQAQGFFG